MVAVSAAFWSSREDTVMLLLLFWKMHAMAEFFFEKRRWARSGLEVSGLGRLEIGEEELVDWN